MAANNLDSKVKQFKPVSKNGLGRGLSALLGEQTGGAVGSAAALKGQQNRINQNESLDAVTQTLPGELANSFVAINAIEPGKFQPRKYFNEEELSELSDSIKKNGVVQPIIVRKAHVGSGFELIAGERRWRAAKLAGMASIPAVIMDLSDSQAMEIALVENIQRQNLKPLEVAEGYQRLIDEFGYTQEQLAEVIGKSRAQISNYLRLVSLPQEVQEMLDSDAITVGHAKVILGLSDDEQVLELARAIKRKNLSVRQTEMLMKKFAANAGGQPRSRSSGGPRDPDIIELEKAVSLKLGLDVSIQNRENAGRVTIAYNSLEQLDTILRKLEG